MVSTNLNPGRKVLKVKPAAECIITEQRSAEGEGYSSLSRFSHTHWLPAQPEAAESEREGLSEEQREAYTVSNHLLLPPSTLAILSPSQCIPNQSAGGAMLVKKPQPFECLLYLQTEACWNQRNYRMIHDTLNSWQIENL